MGALKLKVVNQGAVQLFSKLGRTISISAEISIAAASGPPGRPAWPVAVPFTRSRGAAVLRSAPAAAALSAARMGESVARDRRGPLRGARLPLLPLEIIARGRGGRGGA